MRCNCRRLTIALLLAFSAARAMDEQGLLLQGQVGVGHALSPKFLTTYWQSSVTFGGGFGVNVLEDKMAFFNYTNHAFNYSAGVVPSGFHASAHEIVLSYKQFFPLERSPYRPFYHIGLGYVLLKSPDMYKESEIIPGLIDKSAQLEPMHTEDGLLLQAGVGLCYFFYEEQSAITIELFSTGSFMHPLPFTYVGGRCGVIFHLGD